MTSRNRTISEHEEQVAVKTEEQKKARQYYLEHDGRNRQRIKDVNLDGENNPNWKGGLLTIACVVCGKEKKVKKKDLWRSKYCSQKCSHIGVGNTLREKPKIRISKLCIVCGKEKLVKPSHAKREGTYCSTRCMFEDYKRRFSHMTYDRIDGNQNEIVDALEKVGATVQSLTRVKFGCPDICVGFLGKNYLFEIKVEKGKLTDAEKIFFDKWKGQVVIIRTVDDALKELGIL